MNNVWIIIVNGLQNEMHKKAKSRHKKRNEF